MRIDGVESCQHRRLVLVTLDRMGGYMCFLFPRENNILGDEKITAMKLMEVLPCRLRISEPCRCESWKQCHCPQSPVATLECWRPVLAGCDLWPSWRLCDNGQGLSCTFAGGKSDSSASWIHMEVLGVLNVTWKAVKLALSLSPAFLSRRENRVRENISLVLLIRGLARSSKRGRRRYGCGWGFPSLWYFAKKKLSLQARCVKHSSVFHFLSDKAKCKPRTSISSP